MQRRERGGKRERREKSEENRRERGGNSIGMRVRKKEERWGRGDKDREEIRK